MDWNGALKDHRAALIGIVDEIFALLELVLDGTIKRLPKLLYHSAERLLLPAEAAVRRLIVIASRGMKVELLAPRPMPKDLLIVAKGTGPKPFQLFDTRKTFHESEPKPKILPRIHSFNLSPLVPQFQPIKTVETSLDATQLCRRYHALKSALENLPNQAKRFLRWRLRRLAKQAPKFTSPMRPGPPPGSRKRPRDSIDFILKECHDLAFMALYENTS